ncbi:hybrid sensor histidine kinase/response regulator [Prolixibacter bellariivorans]|uniref:histidine kinase n=1 Tax=Prolixibacter bellariivorans TaxID=314319 RepID=A0A5M4B221_9BACT|nr:hybrid sensor histidine kinase/response regulator transcription factor [Prolixibacter bellariivorans]GET33853.1 hybrid sensor histidine kinase/response regulator [Prolixibacter bellariivorans]
MKRRFVFLFTLLLAFSIYGKGESFNETGFEESPVISNDISNQEVTSFAEDAFGHIWISTIRGLNKYNGYEFHQYFKTNDSLSLCENRIQHLYNDSKNRLWVATVNGVCRYNDQDCFEQIPIESDSKNAFQFFENNDGKLFLSLNYQICVYEPGKNKFVPVIDSLSWEHSITQCFVDKSNNIWLVTPHEVRCCSSHTYKIKKQLKPTRFITFSYLTKDGKLWLASWDHLEIYDTRTETYQSVPKEITNHPVLGKAIITGMYPYNNSSFLIKTQKDGVFLYNKFTGTVVHQSENGFPFEMPNVEITTFFTDSQKNLWIGSYDQGFTVRYSYKERFNNNNYLRSKLDGISVTSVTPDKENNLWIVTRSHSVQIYRNDTKKLQQIPLESLSPHWSPFQHRVRKVFVDRENNIWLLSDWLLLKARYHKGKLEIKKDWYFPTGIMCITQDPRGTIWLGGRNENIYVMRKGENRFELFPLYGKGFKFTPKMITLSTGQVLVATFEEDLQLIDPDTWKVSTIPILKYIKSSKFIPVSLYEDTVGDIWIGTIANGLFRYSTKNRKMEALQGTACPDISSITEDALGNIWVGTLYGLSKYDRTTGHFINYYKEDGIGGNQFNEQSVCRLPDNSLIFGGTHGLTFFNPVDITYKRNIPLVFEDLKIHNKLEHPFVSRNIDKHLSFNPKIDLKHSENSFTISFAALDYCEFERVHYLYKLEGFDKMWIDANNNHEAYYSNVPAGKYTFRVKIYNKERNINETENSIAVRVRPAPWLSWPAILAYIVILVLILKLSVNTYRRIKTERDKAIQAEREKEQEQRVNKMNMSFFSNLSHEFRTPLTMISGPVSMLCSDETIQGENKQLLSIVRRSVNRMLRLVNQLMDFNKLENDTLKLKVEPTDMINELKRSIDIFHLNAREKGIKLNTYGLEDSYVAWIDSDKLEKITANLISNALKFTPPGGEIDISFDTITRDKAARMFPLTEKDIDIQYAKISVADTGKGIPDDKLEKVFERFYQLNNQSNEFYNWGTGIGLYYAQRLTQLHHGFIKAGNRERGGAVFTFIVPVSEIAYSEEERMAPASDDIETAYIQQTEEQTQVIAPPPSKNKPKVLIIDDDTEIVHYLRSILSVQYHVEYKFDADSAYKSLKVLEPDLILCDVVMPGTDGFEFCRMVKENLSFSHIPVILVTAKATVENQVEGLNTGADAYVTKPFDPSYLVALINSQLNNRKKLQNLLGSTTKGEKIDKELLTPHDNSFMTNLYELMENELSNSELNVNRMTEVLKISRTKFYYKVKGLTGKNPNVFFKTYKLNRAAELLNEGKLNISEIADMTGFSTPSHFSVSFKKQFGVSPSEFVRKNHG